MFNSDQQKSTLDVSKIARPKNVIHPALDWVKNQLIVGVVFEDQKRAVLTSKDGLVEMDQVGEVCERDGKFDSPVTPEVATNFLTYLASKPQACPTEVLNQAISELSAYLNRFMIFPAEHWSTVIACWTMGTYMFPVFQAYPYVRLTSPTPGCGKSVLGHLIANLSFNGDFVTSATEANMFHLPEQNRGVQVWDELENDTKHNRARFDSINSILLCGYRNGATVPRQTGRGWDKLVKYHVYCPRVIIGLSELPETTRQRTIELRLEKVRQEHDTEHYRECDHIDEETQLKSNCVLAALKCVDDVNTAYKDNSLRKALHRLLGKAGREADDIWLPLCAIASAAVGTTDLAQNPLLQDLAEAAKELSGLRDSQSFKPSVLEFPGAQHSGSAKKTPREVGPSPALVAALNVLDKSLDKSEGVEPEMLSGLVNECASTRVTAQWLSKNLKPLGIKAKKREGRRVFMPSKEEIRAAQSELGIAAPAIAIGQQGHEGHQI
jgi:hypothetical protein